MNDRINSMLSVQGRISSLKSEISAAQISLFEAGQARDKARRQKYDAERSVESFTRNHESQNLAKAMQAELVTLQQRCSEASQSFAQADALCNELEDDLWRLKGELRDLQDQEVDIDISDIVALQSNIEDSRNAVSEIQSTIDGQDEVVHAAKDASNELESLIQKRSELSADVALGNEAESALHDLDKQIAKAKAQADAAQQAAQDAQGTIQGLEQRLTQANRMLYEHQRVLEKAVFQYVQGSAEQLNTEYSELARSIVAVFKQLHLMNQIMVTDFGCQPIISQDHTKMCIPAFSVKGNAGHGTHFSFFEAMDSGSFAGIEIDAIRKLKELGVLE